MRITPLAPYLDQAAQLFAQHYQRLRASTPALPGVMSDPAVVLRSLTWLDERLPMLAAIDPHGRLAGYLGGLILNGFRNTPRRAAFVPEWAWAVAEETSPGRNPAGQRTAGGVRNGSPALRALYRAAAGEWSAQGVNTHAVSLLADDDAARESWFWHGFGLTVVDAVRPLEAPFPTAALPPQASLRMAGPADIHLLAEIEAEHWQHYCQPPTLMLPSAPDGPTEFAQLLAAPPNSAWLAFHNGTLAGYVRLQAIIDGGAAVLNSPHTIGITGAYVRPSYRGLGLAPALLEAARCFYAAQRDPHGSPAFTCLAVDFESINPEAAAFWPRYFTPVVYSVMRVPERG